MAGKDSNRVLRLSNGLQQFIRTESSGGLVLIATALLAIAWANSPWGDSYFNLWERHAGLGWGAWVLDKSLSHWVNDGLMVLFFLLVGLELKREWVQGQLSSMRQAVLPISTALGGMLVPALIFLLLNIDADNRRGWGIPMATDIAFALAVMALAGARVPAGLKVLLTALAIVDDLGAVLVIALFYTSHINGIALLAAGGILLVLWALNRYRVQWLWVYLLLGIGLWLAVLKSGVHATIAGVLLAFCIPLKTDGRHTQSPLQRLEHYLKNWVAWGVLPLFALANAGLHLRPDELSYALHPIALGVALGLLLGKPIGIMLLACLPVRLGWAQLPAGVEWGMVAAVGVLGGIGFTMSLFVAQLAYADPARLGIAKMGVLMATLASGIMGYFLMRWAVAKTADART